MTAVRFLGRFGPVLLIVAIILATLASGAWRWLSLSDLRTHRAALAGFVSRHYVMGLVLYAVAFVLVVFACTPGPSVMSAAGGFLFGPALGGAAALASCTLGSVLVYLACRSAFGDWIRRRAGVRISAVIRGLAGDPFTYLLSLKLFPAIPYFIPNVAAGIASCPLRSLVAATVIGSAPMCFLLAGLGSGVNGLFDRSGSGQSAVFEPQIIVPLVGLALLSLVPLAWAAMKRFRSSR
ncbi:MAG: TVP38/TMEM64 family protein [Caulobacteraceae bacterium]